MNHDQNVFMVDVVYALPKQQKILQVKVNSGTTAIEVLKLSNLVTFFPEIDLESVKLGVFSNLVKHDRVIEPGDRLEVYRPLIADPKDVRRRRAEKAVQEGRANKVTGGKIK
ncbi:RnfH family protein [Shewanella sp. 202IG2-18]|uniref:RnfH family protein n=1 Tax=Parashewanella hymeniacidonis TaxID=2807618 RepID=UPI00195FD278|nr:RnfH family protein [Parashewanella hymeniacidonis]MBM7074412.1 RnfH family protein [Parashewanella hymeniacidonis]